MRLTASRAFEQYTCLGFLKQIIRRPGGLYDLSNFLTELLNRFLNTSQSHIWSELELYYYELTIRHLCHQIWIELATINELNSEHFDKTEYIGVKNWLEAWIYRVQEVYRLIVNLWQDKMNQFQDNLHILIINQWCDYVTDCIDESELSEMRRNDFPPVNAFLPSHQTSQESQSQRQQKLDNKPSKKEIHFSLLWSLLCDAEMIQEKCSVQLEKLPSKGVYFSKTLQKLKKHLDVYIKNLTTSSSPSSSPSLSNVIPQSKSFDTSHNSLSYLIQQLEYSLHSLPVHYRVFWLEVTNDTGSVTHQSDQLRVILQELRQLRNLCERNCMLCKQSLSLLHKLSLSSLEQHELFAVKNMLQLLNTWNYGYSILRQSLERVIRAGEVVESERYPLRTLNTSELRSESIQMLKQKQAFIEAVQFGLETIRLQMKSTSVKLHEYDTTSKLIDHKTKFQHLLESLKSLYHSILNDDRLKTTNRSEIPDDDLNCLVIARTKQAIELSQLCRKMDQVNWNTAWDGFLEFTNEAKVDSGNSSRWIVYFLQHCHAFSSKINMEEVYQCQINQLEEIMHDWTGWIKK
uniref:Uncharacterized protein n=1 Tax=Trichobilharzia regenti TaxID=157069 RepID=A0AA85JQD0_TRIRE|nr:unnamed protein product [Trichobilharzia regenti]